MRAPTVLHVMADGGVGLAARQLAVLATDPDSTYAHKVALVHKDPALVAYLTEQRVAVFPREGGAAHVLLPLPFVAGRWLSELARRTHADVVHAHDARAASLGGRLAQQLGVPLIRTVSTPHALLPFMQRAELKRTRLFVATSERVQRALLREVPLLAPKMVLSPIALPEPAPLATPFTPGARLRVQLVGVPPHQDGAVVQALREVADLVIGDGADVPHDFDATVIAGSVPLGHDADEPVELAALRAMARGRPAIVVPGGVFEELATPSDAEPCGLVAADSSIEALVATLRQLEPAALVTLGARARAQFERAHSAEKLRARHRAYYAATQQR